MRTTTLIFGTILTLALAASVIVAPPLSAHDAPTDGCSDDVCAVHGHLIYPMSGGSDADTDPTRSAIRSLDDNESSLIVTRPAFNAIVCVIDQTTERTFLAVRPNGTVLLTGIGTDDVARDYFVRPNGVVIERTVVAGDSARSSSCGVTAS